MLAIGPRSYRALLRDCRSELRAERYETRVQCEQKAEAATRTLIRQQTCRVTGHMHSPSSRAGTPTLGRLWRAKGVPTAIKIWMTTPVRGVATNLSFGVPWRNVNAIRTEWSQTIDRRPRALCKSWAVCPTAGGAPKIFPIHTIRTSSSFRAAVRYSDAIHESWSVRVSCKAADPSDTERRRGGLLCMGQITDGN
jgi:hypothetical protein